MFVQFLKILYCSLNSRLIIYVFQTNGRLCGTELYYNFFSWIQWSNYSLHTIQREWSCHHSWGIIFMWFRSSVQVIFLGGTLVILLKFSVLLAFDFDSSWLLNSIFLIPFYRDGTTDVTRTVHFGTPTDYERECFTRVFKGQVSLATAVFPQKIKVCVVEFSWVSFWWIVYSSSFIFDSCIISGSLPWYSS